MPVLCVIRDGHEQKFTVPAGTNLREWLLEVGISPYAAVTRMANCGGRGICATCGVWLTAQEPPPKHWHDQLASRFGYPRLSCQINIDHDMTIEILADKRIWGDRDPQRARRWRR